ncbi:MAG: NAD(P)H-dependent flavin oxidoreductase [Steroidobacteraceae bacterium]
MGNAIRARLAALRVPMMAAPMFLVSGPELVLAACRAGIAGAFPAPNARTLEDLDAWMRRIVEALEAGQAEDQQGPWVLNLVTHSSYDRLPAELELLSRYRPPVVVTALGSPAPVVETVHAYGGLVLADVNSIALARKAAAVGVDGLILVCAGAGGHTGRISPFAFVPAVREFFDGIIVLAGAVSTGAAVRAAELLGADLVSVGTPFIATRESLAPQDYRDMLARASLEDLVLTKALTGAEAYYLRESLLAMGLDPANLADAAQMDLSGGGAKVRAWKHVWSAGQGVGLVHCTEPVATLVERYEREYRAAGVAA